MFHNAPAATQDTSVFPGYLNFSPYGRMEMQSIWLSISVSTHLHLDTSTLVMFHTYGNPCHPMRMFLI
jgi:hypothetical protein